jgi:hypothetical protein
MEHQSFFVGGGPRARTTHGKADATSPVNGYTPRYTFLPRKRTDGGVTLFLQPSRSQQKLNRKLGLPQNLWVLIQ